MGQKDMNFLTKESRAQLQKFGIDPNQWEQAGAKTVFSKGGSGGFAVSFGGSTYTFKSQQDLDNFKRDMGIK